MGIKKGKVVSRYLGVVIEKMSSIQQLCKLSVFILIFLNLSFSVTAATGFTNQQSLYFTGTSSDPGTLYQDALPSSGNADVGIEICGVGEQYVGGFYAIQVGSTWNYALVTYRSSNQALEQATINGGCGEQTGAGFITVSPSTLSTPDPDVYKAGLPGRLWIGYAASNNPGTVSNFLFGDTNAALLGSYTVARSFDQTTRQVTLQTPTITFTTNSGSFSYAASNANFGVSSDKRLAAGICDNDDGQSCNDGGIITSSATFPVAYSTGLTAGQVNDQNTYTRYAVLNGLGYDMCIGANLQATINSATPDPVYYSQNLTIVLTVSNPRDSPYEQDGGNVDVTTDFDVHVEIYNSSDITDLVYDTTYTVTDTIAPGGSNVTTIIWPAYQHSGFYTIRMTVDSGGDIAECDEADNQDTEQFELKPITLPELYIDGEETNYFVYPNVPYNMTFHFKNSDNSTLRNASVLIIEQNGISLTAPTQIYNRTISSSNETQDSGLQVNTTTRFLTDYGGNASFTFIPTYNSLYLEQYNYTNLSNYIGNYNLTYTGEQADGEDFVFVINGQLESEMPLYINFTNYTGLYSDKNLPHETIASQIMDFIYHTFTNFLDTVLS